MKKIKRFIKYKGYPYIKSYLKKLSRARIPIAMITVGAGLLSFGFWDLINQLFVSPSASESQLEKWISIGSKLLGFALVILGGYWCHRVMVKAENITEESSKVIFKQFSIDSSEKNEISKDPKSLMYITLDQRSKKGETRIEWIKRCLNEQNEKVDDYFYVAERWDQPKSSYEGLAHIPFVFLLGYQVSDKINFSFSEWDEHVKKWVPLPETAGSYPPLQLIEKLQEDKKNATEVSICISLTKEILHEQLYGLEAHRVNLYHLKLENCKRHAIVSTQQLEEYKQQFRELMDKINSDYPRLKRVHIFISAQTSLVFNIGSALTRNDVETWIYNFEVGSSILYPWALKSHKPAADDYRMSEYIKIF